MEGGLSRKRGYVVLVLLLAAAFAALLLWRSCRQESAPSATADTALLASLEATDTTSRHGGYHLDRRNPREPAFPSPLSPPTPPREPRAIALELNTADTVGLQRLWGIGPVLSKRIVRYRDLLGGFTDKEQLREVYGLADSVYQRIAPQLTVDTTFVRRLDINTATYGQLVRHPYLDKHQVAAIIRLREKQGPFLSLDDLHRIPIIEQETYNKIIPYLSCNSQPRR